MDPRVEAFRDILLDQFDRYPPMASLAEIKRWQVPEPDGGWTDAERQSKAAIWRENALLACRELDQSFVTAQIAVHRALTQATGTGCDDEYLRVQFALLFP